MAGKGEEKRKKENGMAQLAGCGKDEGRVKEAEQERHEGRDMGHMCVCMCERRRGGSERIYKWCRAERGKRRRSKRKEEVRPGKGKYSQGKVGGQMSGGKPGSTGSRYMQRYRPEPELPVPYPRKRRGKVHGVNAASDGGRPQCNAWGLLTTHTTPSQANAGWWWYRPGDF